jgi:hypothetical protein
MKKLKWICIALFLAIGLQLEAQDDVLKTRVSADIVESNVVELLKYISEEYKIYFSYDPVILDTGERKDYKFENKPLYEILEDALDKSIGFKTINNQVILYNKDNSEIKTQKIRGKIVDIDTQLPLIGASIILKDTEPLKGAVASTDGYYSIDDVPVGRQTVIINFVGYKPVTIDNVMVLSAKEKILNIEMEELVNDIEEVKVVAYSRKEDAMNEMATVGARSFTIEETEKYAGSWGDPSRMAINFAGVVMAGDERNDIVIRGNSPSALIWQLEGIPIPSPNHFDNLGATGGPVSILNNNTLSRSDFFTGAFPAEYGNGYSGVFDLRMRNGNNEKYEYTGQASFAGFELGAEGPISRKNKSSFIVNYRYSMLGVLNKLLWVEGLPQYQDINYKINIPYKKGNISVFGFGGISDIVFIDTISVESSPATWVNEGTSGSKTAFSGIKHTHFLTNQTRIVNSFAWSVRNPNHKNNILRDNISMGSFTDYSDFESNYLFSSKIISKLNRKNLLKSGIRFENSTIKSINYYNKIVDEGVNREIDIDIKKHNVYSINAFADLLHKFSDNFSLNSGIHFQHFMLNNTQSIEPRLGLKYKYSEKGKLSLAYGNHCQTQSLFYYLISDTVGNTNNINLDFTRSHQYVFGYDYSFSKNLRLKIEVYYQQLYEVPVHQYDSSFSLINYGGSDDIAWQDSLVNKGTGKNKGIDITFEKFLSDGYYFLLTTSLFNSTYKGIDGVSRNTRYNGKFVVNALGGYEFKIGKNSSLDFNLRCVYAGGMYQTPINLEESRVNDQTIYFSDKAFEDKLNDYFRLDFRVGLVLQQKRVTHEIGFEITNLTNNDNEYYQYYSSKYDKVMSAYQQGFFPMGLYRISF